MDWRGVGRAARKRVPAQLDLGLVFEAVAARKRWLIGLPLAALVLIGFALCLQPPVYSAETLVLIGPRQAGLIGLRSSVALLDGAGGFGAATSQGAAAHRVARSRPPGDQGSRHRGQSGIRSGDTRPRTRFPRPNLSRHRARSSAKKPGGPGPRSLFRPPAGERAGQGRSLATIVFQRRRIANLPRTPPIA